MAESEDKMDAFGTTRQLVEEIISGNRKKHSCTKSVGVGQCIEFFSAPQIHPNVFDDRPEPDALRVVVRVSKTEVKTDITPLIAHWENWAEVKQYAENRSFEEESFDVLDAIQKLTGSSTHGVWDGVIAVVTGLTRQDVRDHVDLLADQDKVKVAKSQSGWSIWMKARGRFALKERPMAKSRSDSLPEKVFISHGSSKDWMEVQAYIERDIRIGTLELSQEAFSGRMVLQKLDEEASKCSYAVIVMTGDDKVGDDEVRARENVIHEIGFFQGRYGLSRVCLLYEKGVSIPSNMQGLGYAGFPKGSVKTAFSELRREIEAAFPKKK